jgi:hypothetical protein
MASIHDLVTATLSELGLPAPTDIIQTLLMKDNRFVGWKFRYNGGYAIQQAASKSIGFYDEQGKLLKAVDVETGQGAAA